MERSPAVKQHRDADRLRSPLHHCRECGEAMSRDDLSCPRCGTLNDSDGLNDTACSWHEEVIASVLCVICGRPLCEKCCTRVADGFICLDEDHRHLLKEWSLLGEFTSEFEAEMMVGNLRIAGVDTKVFSLLAYDGFLRPQDAIVVRVFVKKESLMEGRKLLNSLNGIVSKNARPNGNGGGSS